MENVKSIYIESKSELKRTIGFADIFDYSNFKADYGKLMELYLRSMHKRELQGM